MVLQKKFRVTSPVQVSIDLFDTTTGKAIQTFFLGRTGGQTSTIKDTITTFLHFAHPIGLQGKAGGGGTNFTNVDTRNFILDFSKSAVIDGTVVLNIPVGIDKPSTGNDSVLRVSGALIRDDGTTSTAIVTDLSSEFIVLDAITGQFATVLSLNFPMTTEIFRRNDKLVLDLQLEGHTQSASPDIAWAFDPQNRNGRTDIGDAFVSGDTTQSTLVIPFNPTF